MQSINKLSVIAIITLVALNGCKNRDINEGEAFQPREIHENISFHFDKITVDGIEYLILEKDNNNPHEGFGFMAFRANKLVAKQDTILAYMKTLTELQIRTYAAASGKSVEAVTSEANELLEFHLDEEISEITKLESNNLKSDNKKKPETEE
ncbi:MAG: hypothetical protein CMB80_11625 [Flammeovirgaceae bacterium]|nr:hypothetical protein [Flammeovirgaceae bacterium]MBE63021.1 hypothetical protein [Flammeovirgaceae bacterium]